MHTFENDSAIVLQIAGGRVLVATAREFDVAQGAAATTERCAPLRGTKGSIHHAPGCALHKESFVGSSTNAGDNGPATISRAQFLWRARRISVWPD